MSHAMLSRMTPYAPINYPADDVQGGRLRGRPRHQTDTAARTDFCIQPPSNLIVSGAIGGVVAENCLPNVLKRLGAARRRRVWHKWTLLGYSSQRTMAAQDMLPPLEAEAKERQGRRGDPTSGNHFGNVPARRARESAARFFSTNR